jgi:diadenosine tetraphosphatase ApaH/serine/threonine PP2A family protein phosphatase
MKIALFSDIHANLAALEAVLVDVDSCAVDTAWAAGDTVGYGPDPNACIDFVRQRCSLVVAGNHEAAATGRISTANFNPYAAAAARWTAEALTEKSLGFLKGLPEREEHPPLTLVHGSPKDPTWQYLLNVEDIFDNLAYFDTPGCVVGHSHLQFMFDVDNVATSLKPVEIETTLDLPMGRYYLNPGSVGQPRDGDARAAWALVDLVARTVEFRRVEYDIPATQAKMEAEGLPAMLISRLSSGN